MQVGPGPDFAIGPSPQRRLVGVVLDCHRPAARGSAVLDQEPSSHAEKVTPLPSGSVTRRADRGRTAVYAPDAGASGTGNQAAALAVLAVIIAGHDRSHASGLPPGGLHPIGADHRPERERSRAWSAGLPRCFGREEASRTRGLCECGGARPKMPCEGGPPRRQS